LKVPARLTTLITKIFLQVRPRVHHYLDGWRRFAEAIPDTELRRQALMSITTKAFHCEGGSIYALLAGPHFDETLRFIIAYQTISDYLDNLCDRSTSLNPEDFRMLHRSMLHALTPASSLDDYYALHREQNDGGYLAASLQPARRYWEIFPHTPSLPRFCTASRAITGSCRCISMSGRISGSGG